MLAMVEGKRQPGQPARKWIDDILMWCGSRHQRSDDNDERQRQMDNIHG